MAMETSRQVSSPDFVYLLHAAPRTPVEDVGADDEADDDFEEGEEQDDETSVEEIDFDD
jgi:hypothetical protein